MRTYNSNSSYCLPDWIAGRYNETEHIAIVFNNLIGETYLFEGLTSLLWKELLNYNYNEPFNVNALCISLKCTYSELQSFFIELINKRIIIDHALSKDELEDIKNKVNETKKAFLVSKEGIGMFNSIYESVDHDYRNRVAVHNIPFTVTIELTYSCNEACIHCYNPNSPREGGFDIQKPRHNNALSISDYFSILDSLARMGVAKIIFTGGDPFMNKDCIIILEYAHKLKFAFSVYTNGQFLFSHPEYYEQLKSLYPQYIGLSLYSTIPDVHDSITRRMGSCIKTMALAERCYKDAISLQIKCPIMQTNKESYGTIYDFSLRLNGIPQYDVNITSGVDGDSYPSGVLRLNKEQLRIVLKDKRIPLSPENPIGIIERLPEMQFCGAGVSSFSIRPDGTVNPCCAFPLDCGNVKKQSVESIWKNSILLKKIRNLRYKDSDLCGKEHYCKYCNRCIGQSYVEHGIAENHSSDNCFLAKVRFQLANES